MIHFSEGSRKVESIDVPSFPLKYDLIKPETSISEKEAHDFWDEMFSEPQKLTRSQKLIFNVMYTEDQKRMYRPLCSTLSWNPVLSQNIHL